MKLKGWCVLVNQLLDKGTPNEARQEALEKLGKELPPFFAHFLEHLRGEEDNLNPIGRRVLASRGPEADLSVLLSMSVGCLSSQICLAEPFLFRIEG
jgi:hypothetical protein